MASFIQHQPEACRFVLQLGPREDDVALLAYQLEGPKAVDLYHTEVPPAHQGRGLAAKVTKAALEHFIRENFTIRASCSYIQRFLQEERGSRYAAHVQFK